MKSFNQGHSTFYIILIILIVCNPLVSQTGDDWKLMQPVTIKANNITIGNLLDRISNTTNIKFAYNPKLIKANKRIDVDSKNLNVEDMLKMIFGDKYVFKARGNYVIIAPAKSTSQAIMKSDAILLSGYILDRNTNDGVAFASIYTSHGNSFLTDETGAFSFELKKDESPNIELRKKGYMPISYNTGRNSNRQIELYMDIESNPATLEGNDSTTNISLASVNKKEQISTIYPIKKEFILNEENVNDTLRRPATISLYPGISTYGNLSSSIIFNFAVNFVGYNRGIEGVELAALSNINRENVGPVQLAGISNYVGGNVTGYQGAGIFNIVNGKMNGLQMAGISNHVYHHTNGLQMAGILNYNENGVKGIQMAGILNLADTLTGAQIGGLTNISDTIAGLQMAGISNHSKSCTGLQIAGIYNQANYIDGIQISGLANYANKVIGSQIGVVNFADTITGIPIGLFSFVRKNGYKRLEVFNDEVFPVNLSFYTGVKKFHTGLFFGLQNDIWKDNSGLMAFGFGAGTSWKIGNSLSLDLLFSSQYISKSKIDWSLSNIYKANFGMDIKCFKNISIALGATINALHIDKKLLDDSDFSTIRPTYNYTYDNAGKSIAWRGWFGYKIGIRFYI